MAVKKKETKDVVVETPEVMVEESTPETPEIPEVVVEEPTIKPEVTVDVEASVVNEKEQPEKVVRIKMNEDHKCCIGGEWYNLKKGQCYNVPVSVKSRLMQVAGLLLPL